MEGAEGSESEHEKTPAVRFSLVIASRRGFGGAWVPPKLRFQSHAHE